MKHPKLLLSIGLPIFLILGLGSSCENQSIQKKSASPNFIIIFADDLGYGDLGCYGHPTIRTPNLDRMAYEGQKWTNFYAGASVCTPSRAALMTGRLPVRSGMTSKKSRVLFPDSKNGLPVEEITIAEQLKKAGYATAAIGKWHLGHKEQYLPTNNGFDYYFGIPYSNDMDMMVDIPYWDYWKQPDDSIKVEHFNVPLLRNTKIVEQPANQHTITKRYSEETISFIRENKEGPFFVYLAHNLPHIPLFASDQAIGKSKRGLYGDVVEEIDHGIGKILDVLESEGLAENTIVMFTSDNGPWLPMQNNGGSAGLLKAGKGTTWEGGMREPAIFWGPGQIESGTISDLGSTMDLFATFCAMASVEMPKDKILDSYDLSATLTKKKPSPRQHILFYRGPELYAARLGSFKAHYVTEGEYGQFGEREEHATPLLYNLDYDSSERLNIAIGNQSVLNQIQKFVKEHKSNLKIAPDQLADRE